MTKPLSPEEKARREVGRRAERERQAIKAAKPSGKTAAQAMEDLRKARVEEARPAIEVEDKAKLDFYAKEDAERKKFVETENAKRAERERLVAERQKAREADADHPGNRGEEKVSLVTTKDAPSPSKAAKKGLERCTGSGITALLFLPDGRIETTASVQVVGRALEDDPWDWHRKRVVCPVCTNRIGTSPYGSRKEALPVGYKIDTHYSRSKSGG